jgi:Fe-S-cluster containining protein
MAVIRLVEAEGRSYEDAKGRLRQIVDKTWDVICTEVASASKKTASADPGRSLSWNSVWNFVSSIVSPIVRLRAVCAEHIEGSTDESVFMVLFDKCAAAMPEILDRVRSDPGAHDIRPYLPEQEQFVCAQSLCTNSCCKQHDLPILISQRFEEDVTSTRGLAQQDFITIKNGVLFLRKDNCGQCVFLGNRDQCTVYDIRPASCIMYPFELVFFDLLQDGHVVKIRCQDLYQRALEMPPAFFKKGRLKYNFIIPLILYHDKCPGFTGNPIQVQEYVDLIGRLWKPYRDAILLSAQPRTIHT